MTRESLDAIRAKLAPALRAMTDTGMASLMQAEAGRIAAEQIEPEPDFDLEADLAERYSDVPAELREQYAALDAELSGEV